jgi:phage terminase large subunit GpA-like protein
VTASAQRLAARIEKARLIEECHQIVRDMLSIAKKAKKDRSSRRRDRTTRATGRTKEERRKERTIRMAAIRADVYMASGGNCAAKCGTPIGLTSFHAHHCIGGGLRQAMESVKTVAPLCEDCHRKIHRSDLDTLLNLAIWAQDTGRREAQAAITKRIAKINEARATVPVRIVVVGGVSR